jgi:DUF1365 family protein
VSVSAIYYGSIRHRRLREPKREFRYRLALAYIDLEELPTLLAGRLLAARPGLVRFRRRDYLGEEHVPLAQSVRDLVAARTGTRPSGPIRLLANLNTFGHCFNPVSFYYCMDDPSKAESVQAVTGESGSARVGSPGAVQAVVAEVTNTPWGERHSYVLARASEPATVLSGSFPKALHVSPFMGMDARYDWRVSEPAETLSVHIESSTQERLVFDATLSMRRRELTRAALAALSARYPAAAMRTLALIYSQALRLKLSGAPTYPHPDRRPAPVASHRPPTVAPRRPPTVEPQGDST